MSAIDRRPRWVSVTMTLAGGLAAIAALALLSLPPGPPTSGQAPGTAAARHNLLGDAGLPGATARVPTAPRGSPIVGLDAPAAQAVTEPPRARGAIRPRLRFIDGRAYTGPAAVEVNGPGEDEAPITYAVWADSAGAIGADLSVASGRHELGARGPGALFLATTVDVPAGVTVEAVVVCEEARPGLRVQVVDEDDQGVARAQVSLHAEETGPGATGTRVLTDSWGQAVVRGTMSGIEPGRYVLCVEKEGYLGIETALAREPHAMAIDLTVTPQVLESGLRVRLLRGLEVLGTVRKGDGTVPPDGAVRIVDLRGDWRAIQVEPRDGTFRFSGLSPGRATVLAIAPGLAPVTTEVVLAARGARSANLTIVLRERAAVIRGHVLAPDGRPVDGAWPWPRR